MMTCLPPPTAAEADGASSARTTRSASSTLQTAERILAATQLVRKGAVFPLDAALDGIDPPVDPDRGLPRHRLIHQVEPGLQALDDVFDNFYPQGSSQWDSLAHIAYSRGVFYNGATDEDVLSGRRNTIDYWAHRGIVGRAIVLDVQRVLSSDGAGYSPDGATAFSVADLERARDAGRRLVLSRLHRADAHWISWAGTKVSHGPSGRKSHGTCTRLE